MKKTIFFKTFIANLLVLSIFTILVTVFTINMVKQWHIRSLIENLKKNTILIEPIVKSHIKDKFDKLDKYIKKLGKMINTRITVIRYDGKVISDSLSNPYKMENHSTRPEVIEALKKDYAYNIRFSTTRMSKMLYLAMPLKINSSVFGVIRTSVFIRDIDFILTKLNKKILFLVFVLFVLSILITFLISRSISKPIKKMSEASKEIENGNLDVKVFVGDTGEIGELAKSFNSMVLHQKNLFKELEENQRELKTILSSINEGLAVVDTEGNILISNENFYKNIDYDYKTNKNKRIWEIYREPILNDIIKEVYRTKKNKSEIIKISDLFFKTSFNIIKGSKLIVITFHNITELKRVEQIKKDFVLNASHELKTPLTSIKGFIETLEDEIPEENKDYLNIIKRNSERLSNIVDDLLLIHKLEDSDNSIDSDTIEINKLIFETINLFQREAKKKNLDFTINSPSEKLFIRGDRYKLEDLIINLINNAVKYTDKGSITVSFGNEDKKNIYIKVADTGIGIEKKYLDRIFERFFVADKSRSRDTGGTGLGLSIVKHIVNIHKGSIRVESEIKKGSAFIVTLPL